MSGFGRKPDWADKRTLRVAAVNVWRAKQQYIQRTMQTRLTERRSRKFAHEWSVNLQGHRSQLDQNPNYSKLCASIEKRRSEEKRTCQISERPRKQKKSEQGRKRKKVEVEEGETRKIPAQACHARGERRGDHADWIFRYPNAGRTQETSISQTCPSEEQRQHRKRKDSEVHRSEEGRREEQIDEHIPLPTMTREQKAEGTCATRDIACNKRHQSTSDTSM